MKEFLKIIYNALKNFYDAFKPLGLAILEMLEYFVVEWLIMREEVKMLENRELRHS